MERIIKSIMMVATFAIASCAQSSSSGEEATLFAVGTYLSKDEPSLQIYRFDDSTHRAEMVASICAIDSPSFLAVDGEMIYAVAENDRDDDAVVSLHFDREKLSLKVMGSELTYGTAPCYVTVDSLRGVVISANYNGGNISIFDINDNKSLSPARQVINFTGSGIHPQQGSAHLHCVRISPDGDYLFAADLGSDKIYRYSVGELHGGAMLPDQPEITYQLRGGSGPRHIVFHPSGEWFYAICELSGEVAQFSYGGASNEPIGYFRCDESGGDGAKSSADIHISSDGRFLYATNRTTSDEIVAFAIDAESGSLSVIQRVETPRHPRNFAISPDGEALLLASRFDNTIVIYKRDQHTGLLSPSGDSIAVGAPVCIQFL